MRRRLMIMAAVVTLGAVVGLLTVAAPSSRSQTPTEADRLGALRADSEGEVRTERHATTGSVRFVGTEPGTPIDVGPAGAAGDAAAGAEAFIDEYGALFGPAAQTALVPVEVEDRVGGGATALYRQEADGVPVLAGEVRVQLDEDAKVLSAGGEASTGPVPSTVPTVLPADGAEAARAAVAKEQQVDPATLSVSEPELWIYDADLLGGPPPHPDPSLVWRLEVAGGGGEPIRELVLVDAIDGSITLRFSMIAHALQRTVCDHLDVANAQPCPPQTRSEGEAATGNADVDAAYDYSGDVYDFFAARFGRDSLDGSGFPLHSRVRFCTTSTGCPYANAFWDGSQMTYGSGYASADDVVAHELTHGFTEFTSDLLYYYQSGAINESLSDVFGEYVDLTNGAGGDGAGVRWKVGEDLPIGAVRDMADPPALGDPDTMTSPNYTGTTADSGGVHTNSGVNNKAASLLVDGGSFNGRTVTGLGIDKAALIYYEVATAFLTSGSDYQDLGDGLVQGCTNLIGQASITTADCVEVGDAVTATEMATVPPAAPAADAPVCDAGDPVDLFAEDFESGLGAWTISTPAGSEPWRPATGYATSGELLAYVPDTDAVVDTRIEQSADVALPADAYLHVAHAYDLEATFDGGVIEYSTDGGTSWSDVTTGGPSFTHSGYDAVVSTAYGNPIGGRSAFTGVSQGYLSSRVDLASLAGQNVRFRFRFGSDTSVADFGWFLDDIRVYTCGDPAGPSLSVSKSADQVSVAAGEDIDWHVAVENTGNVVLTGVSVTDGAAPGCAGAVADIAVGETVTVDCATTTTGGDVGTFSNVASVVANEVAGPTASNQVDVTVQEAPAPSLSVFKSADQVSVAAGEDIDWHVAVENTGNVVLTGVSVTDGAAPGCAGAVADIAVGETVTVDCTVTTSVADIPPFASAGSSGGVATVDTAETDPVASDDVAVAVLIPGHQFTDVPPWIDLAVGWISFHGVADGFPDQTFGPDRQITRAQAMRMLWRLAFSVDVAHEHPFTDVPLWVDQAVDWANDPGGPAGPEPLAGGFGDGTFRPDDAITRAQFIRVIWSFAGALGSSCGPHGLTDVPAWIDPAVSWATCDPDGVGPLEPVATGFTDLTFRPDLPITRAEATRMLQRLAAQLGL